MIQRMRASGEFIALLPAKLFHCLIMNAEYSANILGRVGYELEYEVQLEKLVAPKLLGLPIMVSKSWPLLSNVWCISTV